MRRLMLVIVVVLACIAGVPTPSAAAANACANIAAPTDAMVQPNCVTYGQSLAITVYGFDPDQEISFWVTAANGSTASGISTVRVKTNGAYRGVLSTTGWELGPGDYVFVAQDTARKYQPSVAPFRVLSAAQARPTSPAPQPAPSQQEQVRVAAGVNTSNPAQNTDVLVAGRFTVNGQGIPSVPMTATWYFKTVTRTCSGVSDAKGLAQCPRYIASATPGFTVQIDVTFTYKGQRYTARTNFTPHR